MTLRELLCAATLLVSFAGPSLAFAPGGALTQAEAAVAPHDAGRGLRDDADRAPVRLAQVGSDVLIRLNRLEEEIRRLNGRVEELSFQLLQAQEDMRKRQEDNEFRFQQLEGGGTLNPPAGNDDRRGDAAPGSTLRGSTETAATPNFGEDEIGSLLDNRQETMSDSGASSPAQAQATEGSGELYAAAYNYLLAGDYEQAEQAFRQYAQTYPNASDAPDARYWLGESLFQQQRYTDAAEVFLEAQKKSPESDKAPEMMLKLGMSLARLDNAATACLTYKEAERRYPQMGANVKQKLASEQKSANC